MSLLHKEIRILQKFRVPIMYSEIYANKAFEFRMPNHVVPADNINIR